MRNGDVQGTRFHMGTYYITMMNIRQEDRFAKCTLGKENPSHDVIEGREILSKIL